MSVAKVAKSEAIGAFHQLWSSAPSDGTDWQEDWRKVERLLLKPDPLCRDGVLAFERLVSDARRRRFYDLSSWLVLGSFLELTHFLVEDVPRRIGARPLALGSDLA